MIFSNNLILNQNNIIPSNSKEFFIFKKHWNFSQKILFDIENVDVINLYIVIQSYLWNNQLNTIKLYTFMQDKKSDRVIILNYKNIFIIKKMNLNYFIHWWENITNYDKLYLTEEKIYGIVIVFSPSSVLNYIQLNNINNDDFYNNLKPFYPWNNQIKSYLKFFF